MTTPTTNLQAVLFDLGETLLDTGSDTPDFERDQAERDFRAVFDYLQGERIATPPWTIFYPAMLGHLRQRRAQGFCTDCSVHIGDVMREVLLEMDIPLERVNLNTCVRLTFQYSVETARLYPQAIPALLALRRMGWRLGLVSNTIWPGWCQDEILELLGVRDLLEARVYSADVEYAKPHPSIFRQALRILRVPPSAAVFVGDHLDPDVSGAHSAGMRAILLQVPYRREEKPGIVPDATIASLDELPQALAALDPPSAGEPA